MTKSIYRMPSHLVLDVEAETDVEAALLLNRVKLLLPPGVKIKSGPDAVACYKVPPPLRLKATGVEYPIASVLERTAIAMCASPLLFENLILLLEKKFTTYDGKAIQDTVERLVKKGYIEVLK